MPRPSRPQSADALFQEVRNQIATEVIEVVRDALTKALEAYKSGIATQDRPKGKRADRGSSGIDSDSIYVVGKMKGPSPKPWVLEKTGLKTHAEIKAKWKPGAVINRNKPLPAPMAKPAPSHKKATKKSEKAETTPAPA